MCMCLKKTNKQKPKNPNKANQSKNQPKESKKPPQNPSKNLMIKGTSFGKCS